MEIIEFVSKYLRRISKSHGVVENVTFCVLSHILMEWNLRTIPAGNYFQNVFKFAKVVQKILSVHTVFFLDTV